MDRSPLSIQIRSNGLDMDRGPNSDGYPIVIISEGYVELNALIGARSSDWISMERFKNTGLDWI